MPVVFLSGDQVSHYGRFAAEPGPGELEQFFRLDAPGLEAARSKRAPANRLGFAVLWGSVRMLGVFPTEDLAVVPAVVVRFAAEQLGVEAAEWAGYGVRRGCGRRWRGRGRCSTGRWCGWWTTGCCCRGSRR